MPLSHVYLNDDHLEWWSATVPPTGPVGLQGQARYRAFLREFFSNAARVCGDATEPRDAIDPVLAVDAEGGEGAGNQVARFETFPMRRSNWRMAPNAVQPGPELRVRAAVVNGTPPRFADIAFLNDRGPVRRVIRSDDRTSIWVDFVQPQRAVGLQCGFAGGAVQGRDQARFKLEAWRADGSLVGQTSGSDLSGGNDWLANYLQPIAIRDALGGIRSIRFFCDDPGFEPTQVLFLYRVWYETRPMAFVKQGTLINVPLSTFRGHQHLQHPDLPPVLAASAADPLQLPGDPAVATASTQLFASGMLGFGSISLDLPMDCDRAAVFVRGFKVVPGVGGPRRREPYIQKFSRLAFRLNTTQFPTTQLRQIRFSLDGAYHWGEEERERNDALLAVYWSVLAWNSQRADLFQTGGSHREVNHRRKSGVTFDLPNGAPPADAQMIAREGPEAVYGALFGGATEYRIELPRPVEPQIYQFGIGSSSADTPGPEFLDDEGRPFWEYIIGAIASGGSVGVAAGIGLTKLVADYLGEHTAEDEVVSIPSGPLRYIGDGTRIQWGWGSNLEETLDRDERATTQFGGHVLMGSSLVVKLDEGADRDDLVIARFHGKAVARESNPAPFQNYRISVPLPAEQAIAVLGGFAFKPEDEVRELDVEVRAARFDGKVLVVDAGSGVDISEEPQGRLDEPSIAIAAGGGFSNRERLAFGMPHLAGVKRVEKAVRVVLTTRNAEFDWVDGTRDDRPRVVGYLRNDGNIPVGVRAVRLDGPHTAAFDLRLVYRGVTSPLNAFHAMLPITCMPGERIEVLGSFAPAGVPLQAPVAVGMAASTRVIFSLTSGQPDVSVEARAARRVLQPGGFFFPPAIAYRQVRVTGLQVIGGGTISVGTGTASARPPAPGNAVKRRFALMNYGQDALVVTSLAFAPGIAGLSFRVTQFPYNLGQLRPAGNTRYVLEPGSSLDCELVWAPMRVGPMQTKLVADTNQGRISLDVTGEGIPAS